jgi:maleylpyruvate isomerase
VCDVNAPIVEIEGCRAAHEWMATAIGDVSDAVAQRPSLLPGWSIGHVLTHLARNAEAMHRRVEGAMRGEMVEQYAGGAAGRAAEIEAGARRPAREIIDDAIGWSNRLDATFAALPDDCWVRPVRSVQGDDHPVALLPFRRWREVEIHLVDLGIGITPADWSQGLVEGAIPKLLTGLAGRADPRSLMAWMLGRGPAPPLEPWG